MSLPATSLALAQLALDLLALDPAGLKGLSLRARIGPARKCIEAGLTALPAPRHRIHPDIDDVQLFGGLDLTATLGAGRPVTSSGLAASAATLLLPMAERITPDRAARLAQALDQNRALCLVALDEGADADEAPHPALQDRLGLHVALAETPVIDAATPITAPDLTPARALLPQIRLEDGQIETLCGIAAQFGVASLRAIWCAARAARAHAALQGRTQVKRDDLTAATTLVLAPRATQMPTEDAPSEDTTDAPQDPDETTAQQGDRLPDDMVIDAVRAMLPPDVLSALVARNTMRSAAGSGGQGDRRKGNRRGRPLPPRPGRLDGRNRIDLVATLRAAAPWQPLRRAKPDGAMQRLAIRPTDIRVKRFEDRSDRLVIFAVDASGSAAMARLGEAKGAVEILLGEAYARRDHVALIGFRGTDAELLLPPTRSLVQTKRRLGALPGGGGTPLASGLMAAAELAAQSRSAGLSPVIALLTDGRANVGLDGTGGRRQAQHDAQSAAGHLRSAGWPVLALDTATRPQRALMDLAQCMGATYLPMPRADAAQLGRAVSDALA